MSSLSVPPPIPLPKTQHPKCDAAPRGCPPLPSSTLVSYPNPPALAAAVPSPNTLPPVEPRGLEKVGADPNAGDPPKEGELPKAGGLPNTGAAPKPPEQNRGKRRQEQDAVRQEENAKHRSSASRLQGRAVPQVFQCFSVSVPPPACNCVIPIQVSHKVFNWSGKTARVICSLR